MLHRTLLVIQKIVQWLVERIQMNPKKMNNQKANQNPANRKPMWELFTVMPFLQWLKCIGVSMQRAFNWIQWKVFLAGFVRPSRHIWDLCQYFNTTFNWAIFTVGGRFRIQLFIGHHNRAWANIPCYWYDMDWEKWEIGTEIWTTGLRFFSQLSKRKCNTESVLL